MIKLETKTAVYTACNNGSSSIITKDGELFMFGKDAIYSDSTCELIQMFNIYLSINIKYSLIQHCITLHRPGDRPQRSLCNSGRHG